MPYIKQEDRVRLQPVVDQLDLLGALRPGELNYLISVTCGRFMDRGRTYALYNAAIGVLECAKLELYRRMVAPYEDVKRKENGDVY